MQIQIPSTQIPQHWELIKFAAQQAHADIINPSQITAYCRNLLIDLLSDKLCCVLKIDPDSRAITAVLIYEVIINKLDGAKSVHGHTIYSFSMTDTYDWVNFFTAIVESFQDKNYEYIEMALTNDSLVKLAKEMQCKLKAQIFVLPLK